MSGTSKTDEFTETVTIDGTGWRVTPTPTKPRGTVAILGCSFTFGACVNDDQTFSYILGRDYWPYYKVINMGCSAYGTGQCYLHLQSLLEHPPLPKLVLYGWIGGHLVRNYISVNYMRSLIAPGSNPEDQRRTPHFEIENGELINKGLAGPDDGVPYDGACQERERRITERLIVEMDKMCRAENVPFYVIILDENTNGRLLPDVESQGVKVIDLRHVGIERFPDDPHPTPNWHCRIAQALGSNPDILEILK